MTTPRKTKRRTTLERHKAEVINYIVEGQSNYAIAKALKCTTYAVGKFKQRHADEIESLFGRVEKQVEDYAIAQKVNRIAALDDLYRRLATEADGHGLAEETPFGRQFRASLVRELRGVLKDAAEELGQLPKAASGDTYNIDKAVLVRYIEAG